MGGDESNEKKFRRLFRAALDSEVEPGLSAFGFEIKGAGGCSLQWNDASEFARNIRESKWNTFGADEFEVLFSVWMIEDQERWVRGIWLPIPHQWRFDTVGALDGLGERLLDCILR